MPKIDVNHNRPVLSFATELQLFAMENAPNPRVEAIVQKAVTRIRSEWGTSRGLKRSQILAFMRTDDAGDSVSIAELCERFHWKADWIRGIMNEILAESPSPISRFKVVGPLGGNPATRYRLISPS